MASSRRRGFTFPELEFALTLGLAALLTLVVPLQLRRQHPVGVRVVSWALWITWLAYMVLYIRGREWSRPGMARKSGDESAPPSIRSGPRPGEQAEQVDTASD